DSRNELRHAQQLRLTPDQRQELQDRISTLQQEISDAAVIGAHGRDAAEAGRELADMRRQLEDALAQQRADEELGARIEALSDEVTSTEPTLHPRVIEPLHGRNDGLAGLRTDLGTNVEKVTRDVAAARDALNDTKAHHDAVKTAFDDLGKHKAAAAKAAKRAADEAGLIALSSLPSGALVNLESLANFDMLLDAITSMASNVASSTGANRADIEAQFRNMEDYQLAEVFNGRPVTFQTPDGPATFQLTFEELHRPTGPANRPSWLTPLKYRRRGALNDTGRGEQGPLSVETALSKLEARVPLTLFEPMTSVDV